MSDKIMIVIKWERRTPLLPHKADSFSGKLQADTVFWQAMYTHLTRKTGRQRGWGIDSGHGVCTSARTCQCQRHRATAQTPDQTIWKISLFRPSVSRFSVQNYREEWLFTHSAHISRVPTTCWEPGKVLGTRHWTKQDLIIALKELIVCWDMNKYGDNYCGAWLLHDKMSTIISPFSREGNWGTEGGHWVMRNRGRIQMQAVGLHVWALVTNESLLFEDALMFPASKRFVL